jgi:hypothetical protein
MREPAEAAEGRRGDEGASRGEAGGPQLRAAPPEHGVDPGRDRGVLDGHPAVALDEHDQDVLAAEAGEQPVAGSGGEAVVGDLAGEGRAARQRGPHVLDLVDRQAGGARGGDRRADDPEGHPDHAQRRRRAERPGAVAGRDPRHAKQRQDRDGEDRDDEHGRGRDDEIRGRRADRVPKRLDADPQVARVVERPERPVERRVEADVEHLDEHEQAQDHSRDHDQHAARRDGQQGGHRDDDEQLERKPRERAEVEVARLVWRDERRPDEQQGQHRDRHGDARAQLRVRGGVPPAPQPPHALAHRRREQRERGGEEGLRERKGQDAGGRKRRGGSGARIHGSSHSPARNR